MLKNQLTRYHILSALRRPPIDKHGGGGQEKRYQSPPAHVVDVLPRMPNCECCDNPILEHADEQGVECVGEIIGTRKSESHEVSHELG